MILGGLGKGQDFSELSAYVMQWVDSVYLIGQDAPIIEQDLLKGDAIWHLKYIRLVHLIGQYWQPVKAPLGCAFVACLC